MLHTIPASDWEATPTSVKTLLLSLLPLAGEVSELRAQMQQTSPSIPSSLAAISEQRLRIERYQSLVDRSFLHESTPEEQQELDYLGAEIDAGNAPFFRAALQQMEAAATQRK